ncbi:transcriptional regulator, TetR family [Beutenbergia cavernae DSM 12333]|uniref:Transcriptional regulator, TetR family n=1 Tax=Beutenbergia cavernae (strain ATCC BAA-8 / DSM 12333 / CCUG 43141 / JCM 11478 / NBRC 16432 / NCIMB 13614 / HKI 0122) TaxID=471853 RepID=C5BVG0_BEUC1|nr:TetR/AcrR family transcriptional regulator [Beutenbergia cavernae]ACQ78400.1 transcriptional regulator, TetR family [Beutenbergia cavernae DSM 12333]
MDSTTAEQKLLDAADALFYDRGINAVSMDAIREVSGVSLKRTYQLFPSKEHLVEAVLRVRDTAIRQDLAAYTSARTTPTEQILAVFDYLYDWFSTPEFRGCAFINSFAELRGSSPGVVDVVRTHKRAVADLIAVLVAEAGRPTTLAGQLLILANGAMVTAAIADSPQPAREARDAAERLLR